MSEQAHIPLAPTLLDNAANNDFSVEQFQRSCADKKKLKQTDELTDGWTGRRVKIIIPSVTPCAGYN